jgi:hypothetical protein
VPRGAQSTERPATLQAVPGNLGLPRGPMSSAPLLDWTNVACGAPNRRRRCRALVGRCCLSNDIQRQVRCMTNSDGSTMRIWPVPVFAMAHLALWLASAFVARGWDLDHISARSTGSQCAETVYRVLSFPHDPLLHGLMSLLGWSASVVVGAMAVSSFLWGLALCAVWYMLRTCRRAASRQGSDAVKAGSADAVRPSADVHDRLLAGSSASEA